MTRDTSEVTHQFKDTPALYMVIHGSLTSLAKLLLTSFDNKKVFVG